MKHAISKRDLGVWLKALRERTGLTQAKVAARLRLSDETISRLERGVQWPEFEIFAALAKLYGVEWAELMAASPSSPVGDRPAAVQEVIDLLNRRTASDIRRAKAVLEAMFAPDVK